VNQLLDTRRQDAFFKKKKRQSIHLRYDDSDLDSSNSTTKKDFEEQEGEDEIEMENSRSRKRSAAMYQDFESSSGDVNSEL